MCCLPPLTRTALCRRDRKQQASRRAYINTLAKLEQRRGAALGPDAAMQLLTRRGAAWGSRSTVVGAEVIALLPRAVASGLVTPTPAALPLSRARSSSVAPPLTRPAPLQTEEMIEAAMFGNLPEIVALLARRAEVDCKDSVSPCNWGGGREVGVGQRHGHRCGARPEGAVGGFHRDKRSLPRTPPTRAGGEAGALRTQGRGQGPPVGRSRPRPTPASPLGRWWKDYRSRLCLQGEVKILSVFLPGPHPRAF